MGKRRISNDLPKKLLDGGGTGRLRDDKHVHRVASSAQTLHECPKHLDDCLVDPHSLGHGQGWQGLYSNHQDASERHQPDADIEQKSATRIYAAESHLSASIGQTRLRCSNTDQSDHLRTTRANPVKAWRIAKQCRPRRSSRTALSREERNPSQEILR